MITLEHLWTCDGCGILVGPIPVEVASDMTLVLCSRCNAGIAIAGGGYGGEEWSQFGYTLTD